MKKIITFVKTNFVLILVCLLFLGTRLFRISEIPSSVYWDEASIGYNAYSVLTTGKDEWGETLPLHFRAFGEFKLPVYIYSVVISEFIFGVNTFAVRFPSVIFGLLSVIGLYLIVLKLTKEKFIALLSSFLLTITPWFFIFSRTGYEAVAGLAFFIWAIYFLNKKTLVISTLLFIISAYSYNSFRILATLVLGSGLLYFAIKKEFKIVIVSVLILIVSILPIYKLYKLDSGLGRFQTVSDTDNFMQNYLKNFSPKYLFVSGDSNPRSQMPGNPQLYKLDALFLLFGLLFIAKSKKLESFAIIGLLLIAPIPAALTRENPHALRSILMSPVLIAISAMGVYYFSNLFKKYKSLILLIVICLYALSFEGYIYKFGTEYNKLSSSAWQYEYKEIFEKQKGGCVSDKFAQPYIFALFYQKIEPNKFIKTRQLNPVSDWGFSTVKSFGNFNFPKICPTK
jgi:4-amino-4-deoxy-L-arabinose transferase-like glycosyltransferase